MADELIPQVFDVTNGDSAELGYVSNDPFFSSVIMLLHGDGTGTAVVDSSIKQNTFGVSTLAQTATTPKFGAASIAMPAGTMPNASKLSTGYALNSTLDILSGSADFTIDGWVWLNGGSNTGHLVCMDYGGSQGTFGQPVGIVIDVAQSGGVIQLFVTTNIINSVTSQGWINANPIISGSTYDAWHHIAVVRHNGVPFIFFDGVAVAQLGGSNWVNYAPNWLQNFTVGNTSSYSGPTGLGKTDEWRVTKGVARWVANFTPPTSPTVAYPVRRGFGNGFIDGSVFGTASPAQPLIDFDPVARIGDHTAGTATSPIFTFELSVEGEMLSDDLHSVAFTDQFGVAQDLLVANATFTTDGLGTYGTWSWPQTSNLLKLNSTEEFTVLFEDPNQEFNCDCETVSSYSTLLELRIRMAIQCGYSAMATNLPVGQAMEFNEYLFSSQKQLYYKFKAQRTERFFRWTMERGRRYYDLAGNDNVCDAKLDPLAVTWVGFEDLNKAWYRLIEGIDPVYYTRANINFGWPTRYEIRQCLEIFPAPQAAYTLWVKGDVGLLPFVADSDRPTFDDEAVLLFAIANWKSAKGRQDAERCMGQATQRIQDLTARKHATARYVPSTYVQNPATPPRFLPLGSQQS